jgi:outer membrane protein assembly factor BamB
MPPSNLERPVPAGASRRRAQAVRSPRLRGPSLAAATAALAMTTLLARSIGVVAAVPRESGGQRGLGRAARLARIIDLPGLPYLIDPNGRMVYLAADGSDSFDQVLAFDWRRSRVLWRTRVVKYLAPVGVTPSTLVLTNRPDEPQTWAPTAGLDLRTGRVRWQQSLASARREGLIGITVAGEFIFKALPARLICLRAATGRTVWARDFGSQMTRTDWPYPPAVADGSVFALEEVEGTRAVAVRAKDGSTRWSHSYPWAVSFEGPPEVRRVGPLAAAGSAVIALIPTGPQKGEPGGPTLYPPPSALYCWDAHTGKLRWRRPALWTNEALMTAGGVVIAWPGDGAPVAYSMATGEQVWRLDGQMSDLRRPRRTDGPDILLSGWGSRELPIEAVDVATGRVRWRVGLPGVTTVWAHSFCADGREALVAAEESPPTGPPRFRLYVISIAAPWRHRARSRVRRGYAMRPLPAGGRAPALVGEVRGSTGGQSAPRRAGRVFGQARARGAAGAGVRRRQRGCAGPCARRRSWQPQAEPSPAYREGGPRVPGNGRSATARGTDRRRAVTKEN